MVSTSNPKTIEEITDLRIPVSSVLTSDKLRRDQSHRGLSRLAPWILDAMTGPVTCPAADNHFVIAEGTCNC